MRSLPVMRGAEPISPDDIVAAERRLGFQLPPALVTLCLHGTGGRPDRSWLLENRQDVERQVDWFLPITPQNSPDKSGIVETYAQMTDEGFLPAASIPFAIDAGGNFFLVDRVTERVWFMPMDEWEHEETAEQNWTRSGRTVADSFGAFLDALTDEAPEWARG